MRRFFVEGLERGPGSVSITGEELHHLKRVLRLREGTEVILFNGRGLECVGRLRAVGRDSAVVDIERWVEGGRESSCHILLLQCLVKGDRPELIVQKATELGVRRIFFYSTGRSVPSIEGTRRNARLRRLRRVAVEAAKQCGRSLVPGLDIGNFREALESAGDSFGILLWEAEGSRRIKDMVRGMGAKRAVAVCVGPEGGFSERDAGLAISMGFVPASFGPRILRSETAAIAAISVLQYEMGDMG